MSWWVSDSLMTPVLCVICQAASWYFVSAPQLMLINDLQGCMRPELPANSSQNEWQPLSNAGPNNSVASGFVVLDPHLVIQSVPGPVKSLSRKIVSLPKAVAKKQLLMFYAFPCVKVDNPLQRTGYLTFKFSVKFTKRT